MRNLMFLIAFLLVPSLGYSKTVKLCNTKYELGSLMLEYENAFVNLKDFHYISVKSSGFGVNASVSMSCGHGCSQEIICSNNKKAREAFDILKLDFKKNNGAKNAKW